MPFPESVPVLTDGVVHLRPHAEQDVERIVEQCVDPESVRWTQVPRDYTADLAREWIATTANAWDSGTGQIWAITEGDGVFLGSIDLRHRPGGLAEVGFGLHPQSRGRGVMARALRLTCRHWFDSGGQRVEWLAERGNLASWAVARAAGFDFVATLPGHHANGEGTLVDTWFATLGRDDPMEPRTPWLTPPVLEGDGVRLRPWREGDAETVEAPDNPPHFVPARALPTSDTWTDWLGRRQLSMARGKGLNWCIADAGTDEALGEVLIFVHSGALTDGDTAELGYFLYPRARGRGAARAAARLAIAHAFAPAAEGGLGLRRLVAGTAADNVPSNAVLESAGFTRWGHEQAATAPDGSTSPADHWELFAP